MRNRLLLLMILGALLAGCAKATKWPGYGPEGPNGTKPPVNAPSATNPTPGGQPSVPPAGTETNTAQPQPAQPSGAVPGDTKALEVALSAPSHLRYQIEVVTEPVDDPTKYLDDRMAKSPPGPNELLFLLFATKNYDIRFGMGAMDPPLSADAVYAQVKATYLPKKGDPAGGLAALITALNQQP
jgi:hypothetical protein